MYVLHIIQMYLRELENEHMWYRRHGVVQTKQSYKYFLVAF